ncbi:glycosyl transferase [Vibrio cyclitrophicus]
MVVVSVSTLYSRLSSILPNQFPSDERITYVISCQGVREYDVNHYELLISKIFGCDCRFVLLDGYGLSRNRNSALRLASKINNCSAIYITDDDVFLNVDGICKLAKKLNENSLGFCSGKVSTGMGFFKSYRNNSHDITLLKASKLSSVELMVSPSLVIDDCVLFDERFGLGSVYPSGEELIFCSDAITLGNRGMYFPIVLCEHPPISSGQDFYSSEQKIIAKGAMFKRAFGEKGLFLMLFFALKKYTKYRGNVSFWFFLSKMFKGYRAGFKG